MIFECYRSCLIRRKMAWGRNGKKLLGDVMGRGRNGKKLLVRDALSQCSEHNLNRTHRNKWVNRFAKSA